MKRNCLLGLISICSAAMLAGCGHNAVVFGKGFGFRAGLDPEHFSADFSVIYGEQLTLAGRDNIRIRLSTDVSGGSETATASTSADSMLEISIGQQVNGYFVEALETGVSADQISALYKAGLSVEQIRALIEAGATDGQIRAMLRPERSAE